jgi:hypothetical protein
MNINDAFPSKYLKATDLPEEGSQVVTIEKIALEEVGLDKETKPVIYFEEFSRALVCNKTNARTIARALGSEDFDDWIGQKISLYRADVQFQGEMVEAIRVKGQAKKLEKPARPVATPSAAGQDKPKKFTTESEIEYDEDGIPF